MTLLYRTPNIVVETFEFHATIEVRRGRVGKYFRWRPLSRKPQMWRQISEFKGHPPKPRLLSSRFAPFQRHMLQAAQSVAVNAEAAKRWACP